MPREPRAKNSLGFLFLIVAKTGKLSIFRRVELEGRETSSVLVKTASRIYRDSGEAELGAWIILAR